MQKSRSEKLGDKQTEIFVLKGIVVLGGGEVWLCFFSLSPASAKNTREDKQLKMKGGGREET